MANKSKSKPQPDDILAHARKMFGLCEDAEQENRAAAVEDMKFAREDDYQWPAKIKKKRERAGRPCITINKLPAFIRQVVNDARQNKPQIKVHPADSTADVKTAAVIDGLIRNIEYTSDADVAYDTGTECAVSGGFGYWRISLDPARDDSFDTDITIKRCPNPFAIYGDPRSQAADSSDWNVAFVVDRLSRDEFEAEYGDAAKVDWDDSMAWKAAGESWRNGEEVLVAEYWTREEIDRAIVALSDGSTLAKDDLEKEDVALRMQTQGLQIVKEDVVKSWKVTQRIMTGVEILKEREWPGKYIPIIPVYGDEFDIEGKRYFRSLIHNSKDAQRMFNYWRTASTELVALAPKVPWIVKKGSVDEDIDKWQTANIENHAFLEYEGETPPIRIPLDSGVAAGALQEALNASDDMKAIIGLYDASLGARSNETSGKAIQARQREGDVSTFHFMDNQARAIRHTGRVIIDLIPHVYNSARIVRTIGEDGKERVQKINQPAEVTDEKGNPVQGPDGVPLMHIYDLTAGKYDLTVKSGPSFTTRRQEAAQEMVEMMRAVPQAAEVILPRLVKALDWQGADEMADDLEKQKEQQVPPQLQKQMQEMQQQIAKLSEENQNLKMDQSNEQKKLENDLIVQQEKVKNEYLLGVEKIRAEKNLQAMQAVPDAVSGADELGNPVVKQGSEAVMEGLQMIAQMLAQQSQLIQASNRQTLQAIMAPTTLIRDANGRAVASQKVMQ